MKFSAREDLDATAEAVFREFTNVRILENAAIRRGVDVERSHSGATLIEGESCVARFRFRGRMRKLEAKVETLKTPELMCVRARIAGVVVHSEVELFALSRSRTRVALRVTLEAKTLPAKILIQSLKLTRGSVERKFRKRYSEAMAHVQKRTTGGEDQRV